MSDMIPAGSYRAVAVPVDTDDGKTYCQFGESKTKRTPQVVVNFEILDGENAGRRIAWFGYFSDASVQRTVESLRYCGFKGDDLAMLVTQTLDQEVQIVVQHEEFEGKTRAKVAWVNRAGGGGFKLAETMKNDDLRRFAAQMKNSVRQVPEMPGKKAERTERPARSASSSGGSEPSSHVESEPGAPLDDGIPF